MRVSSRLMSSHRIALLCALSVLVVNSSCRKKPPVVVAPVAAPAPPPAPPPYVVTLEAANRAFAAADYAVAARDFERYLELAPSGGEREHVLIRLALIHALPVPEVQDWPRATGLFKQLATEFPQSPWNPVSQLIVSMRDQTTSLTQDIQKMRSESAQIQIQLENLKGYSSTQTAQIAKLEKDKELLQQEIDKQVQKIKDLTNDLQRLIRIDSRAPVPPRP